MNLKRELKDSNSFVSPKPCYQMNLKRELKVSSLSRLSRYINITMNLKRELKVARASQRALGYRTSDESQKRIESKKITR